VYKIDEQQLAKMNFSHSNYQGRNVIVRSCLNVSYDDEQNITDDTRLLAALPLLKRLEKEAKSIVVLGHLGRPEGKKSKEYSLKPVANFLNEHLQEELVFVDNLSNAREVISANAEKKVFLLENTRFDSREQSKKENKRMELARELAALGELFINDAFPDYRKAASTYEIAKLLPSYIGPAFISEIENLSNLADPSRPYVALLGGAKLSEKIDLIGSIAPTVDKLLVGGALAYTLLKAKGVNIGNSIVEEDKIEVASEILNKFPNKLMLPIDHITVSEFTEPEDDSLVSTTSGQEISNGRIGVDIGPKTIEVYTATLEQAETILWNGPMGVFEWDATGKGTKSVMAAIAENDNSYSVTGGGDSLSAIEKFAISDFNHISTGGGAMLSFLSAEDFPTLDVIK
jgi:3-phosphoglycerate kinase